MHGRTLHAAADCLPGGAKVGCADVPTSDILKRLFLGRALRSERMGDTLLPKRIALPVFASDALSSNAYATQEILLVLSLGGYSLYSYGPWIAAMVVVIYFTVVASYRQNVHAYPSGGGDYEVVSHNLGPNWGVFVASALLIDYVLTVAVSISAAVANLGSTIPFVDKHNVWFAVGFIIVITLLNLRGVKESGAFFAIPVYFFVASIVVMIGFAIVEMAMGQTLRAESADWTIVAENTFTGAALVFLVARAFSSGTTALTGIEAVANGVPAFRKPKSKNAATTLLLLGVISMTMFVGITWLALKTEVKVTEFDSDLIGLPPGEPQKTVIVQIADAVFHHSHIGVLVIALATATILALAANTAFNGFPVLGSVLARDGYLPRQLHTRGDRLAFSNGILSLAALARGPRHRLPGRRQRPDPAVHHRRVRVVHAQPAGDGPALDAAPGPRDRSGAAGTDDAVADHQRIRARDDRIGPRDRPGDEVHEGRVDRRRRDAADLPADALDPPPLRAGRRRDHPDRQEGDPARARPRDRSRQQAAQADAARARLRPRHEADGPGSR